MSAEMETAWGHVPALRYASRTGAEYIRLQYELKYGGLPPTVIVELIPGDHRESIDEWFRVRIQVHGGTSEFDVQPEDVVLWLPHYVLHVQPTGEAFAYFPNGTMANVITERMIP